MQNTAVIILPQKHTESKLYWPVTLYDDVCKYLVSLGHRAGLICGGQGDSSVMFVELLTEFFLFEL